MKEVDGYNLSKKEFKDLEKLADNIYNNCVVLEYFCANQSESEDLYNITPLVKTIRHDSDIINSFFINANDSDS